MLTVSSVPQPKTYPETTMKETQTTDQRRSSIFLGISDRIGVHLLFSRSLQVQLLSCNLIVGVALAAVLFSRAPISASFVRGRRKKSVLVIPPRQRCRDLFLTYNGGITRDEDQKLSITSVSI